MAFIIFHKDGKLFLGWYQCGILWKELIFNSTQFRKEIKQTNSQFKYMLEDTAISWFPHIPTPI